MKRGLVVASLASCVSQANAMSYQDVVRWAQSQNSVREARGAVVSELQYIHGKYQRQTVAQDLYCRSVADNVASQVLEADRRYEQSMMVYVAQQEHGVPIDSQGLAMTERTNAVMYGQLMYGLYDCGSLKGK